MANQQMKSKRIRQKQEDVFTYRILLTLIAVVLFMFALMQVSRGYTTARLLLTTERILIVLKWVMLGLFAILEVLALAFLRIKKNGRQKISKILALAGLVCLLLSAVSFYIVRTYGRSMGVLYAALPVLALLYLFYYIYTREFFLLALYTSGGALGLWFLSQHVLNDARRFPLEAGYAAAIAVILLSGAFFYLLKKGDGVLPVIKKVRFLPQGCRYLFLFIACGALLALVILTMFFGWSIAWYGVIALFSYLFIMAVYYTVRMM